MAPLLNLKDNPRDRSTLIMHRSEWLTWTAIARVLGREEDRNGLIEEALKIQRDAWLAQQSPAVREEYEEALRQVKAEDVARREGPAESKTKASRTTKGRK